MQTHHGMLGVLAGATLEKIKILSQGALHVAYYSMCLGTRMNARQTLIKELRINLSLSSKSNYVEFVKWIIHHKRDPAIIPKVSNGIEMPDYRWLSTIFNLNMQPNAWSYRGTPSLRTVVLDRDKLKWASGLWEESEVKHQIVKGLYEKWRPDAAKRGVDRYDLARLISKTVVRSVVIQLELGLLWIKDVDAWIKNELLSLGRHGRVYNRLFALFHEEIEQLLRDRFSSQRHRSYRKRQLYRLNSQSS